MKLLDDVEFRKVELDDDLWSMAYGDYDSMLTSAQWSSLWKSLWARLRTKLVFRLCFELRNQLERE